MYKVLIADDNKQTANGLAEMLDWDKIGCTPAGVAYNGKQAFQMAEEQRPNAVITDVEMPLMNGIELSKKLYENYPGIKIIMLSAYDKFEYAKAALEYNVQDYVLKPLTREKIASLEKKLISFRISQQDNLDSWKDILHTSVGEQISKLIMAGDAAELYGYFLSLPAFAEPVDFYTSKEFAKNLLVQVYSIKKQLKKGAHESEESFQTYMDAAVAASSMQDVLTLLKSLSEEICALVNEKKTREPFNLVEEIKDYINKNLDDSELNISSLCRKFNISTSYLSALFRKHQSGSINSYIILARNDLAKRLLSETQQSVSEIAAQCGYYDSHYFSRAFKKMQGVTPKEYRQLYNREGL